MELYRLDGDCDRADHPDRDSLELKQCSEHRVVAVTTEVCFIVVVGAGVGFHVTVDRLGDELAVGFTGDAQLPVTVRWQRLNGRVGAVLGLFEFNLEPVTGLAFGEQPDGPF